MNIIGIIVKTVEQLELCSKDFSNKFKRKCLFVYLLTPLALDIKIILLITNNSAGID